MRSSAVQPSESMLRRRLPDAVPRGVGIRRADAERVELHAGRVDVEEGAAEVVVVRVDHDLEVVRLHVAVATDEARDDVLRSVLLVHARADVQRFGVVDEAHVGALGARLPFLRVDLGEVRDGRRLRPGLVVETAVERRCCRRAATRPRWERGWCAVDRRPVIVSGRLLRRLLGADARERRAGARGGR